jgi:hypothetical protein
MSETSLASTVFIESEPCGIELIFLFKTLMAFDVKSLVSNARCRILSEYSLGIQGRRFAGGVFRPAAAAESAWTPFFDTGSFCLILPACNNRDHFRRYIVVVANCKGRINLFLESESKFAGSIDVTLSGI